MGHHLLVPGYRMTRALLAVIAGAACFGLFACGDDEPAPPPRPPGTSSSTGAGLSGGGGAGGDGGNAQGGAGGAAECGDGVVNPGEGCDGADLGGQTCPSFGFDDGNLSCKPDCTVDTSTCSGVEQCQDAKDNDGDALEDCNDTDCAAACADVCASAPVVPDPFAMAGDTTGHAPLTEPPSCADPAGGPAVAYEFTATITGFLEVELVTSADADFSLSLRSSCAAAAAEIACANDAVGGMGATERISTPITAGDTVHVLVSGAYALEEGPFAISILSRDTVCGDGFKDPTEECDDLNTEPGDGCSGQCLLEATEVEPNDTTATANAHVAPFFAAITPAGDEDVVTVVIPSGPSSLVVETIDVGAAGCLLGDVDSYLEILDAGGMTVLASNDDGGTGSCARAIATGLPAGAAYVRVKASPSGFTPTFPYRLDVTVIQDICGDMAVTPAEQCDDGNMAAGDGCSPACQFELDETEPNDAPGQAGAYSSPWLATLSPAGDADFISVTVPGPASTIAASTSDNGTGACVANTLDSYLEIFGPDGATLLQFDDDSGDGYCSAATAAGLPGGTYFVRVRAAPLVPNATFFYELVVTTL